MLHPKYFYANSNSSAASVGTADVTTNKLTLYISRFTNSSGMAELFKNNVLILSKTELTALQDSVVTVYIGAQEATVGHNADINYVSIYSRPLSNADNI